jgi:hypothetical protein
MGPRREAAAEGRRPGEDRRVEAYRLVARAIVGNGTQKHVLIQKKE